MATKNLIPRGDGEGGIGKASASWGEGHFKTGHFEDVQINGSSALTSSDTSSFLSTESDGSLLLDQGGSANASNLALTISGHILPATTEAFDIGSANKKIRHLYLSDSSIYIGDNDLEIKSEG